MLDVMVAWLLAHPLQGVGGLVLLSVAIGLMLIPRVHEITHHGHPRC